MKKIITTVVLLVSTTILLGQKETLKDTTRMKFGKIELLVVDHTEEIDTIDAGPDADTSGNSKDEKEKYKGHWAGVDMGFTIMMNEQFGTSFDQHPYMENDPAKSMVWNINVFEHKFPIYKNYIGFTTGLGFSFTQQAFKNNYVLQSNADSVYATIDTVVNYSKNKLRATYLTLPLLLEFGGKKKDGFYLATGVVGGVRIGSKLKQKGEVDHKIFKEENKGIYGLSPFKLDATIRLGYGFFGAFASYDILPLFDTKKTVAVHPLVFGITANF